MKPSHGIVAKSGSVGTEERVDEKRMTRVTIPKVQRVHRRSVVYVCRAQHGARSSVLTCLDRVPFRYKEEIGLSCAFG